MGSGFRNMWLEVGKPWRRRTAGLQRITGFTVEDLEAIDERSAKGEIVFQEHDFVTMMDFIPGLLICLTSELVKTSPANRSAPSGRKRHKDCARLSCLRSLCCLRFDPVRIEMGQRPRFLPKLNRRWPRCRVVSVARGYPSWFLALPGNGPAIPPLRSGPAPAAWSGRTSSDYPEIFCP